MHGFLVVDKPAGITSHDVVARIRRLVGIRQVGHTGTLDPFATGVLVVACGAATKAIPYLDESYKSYRAVLRLGETTDTQDCTGTVTSSRPFSAIDDTMFHHATRSLIGQISQIPPMYSAVKQGGVPLYRLARAGQEVEREPRLVDIAEILVESFSPPEANLFVHCSKGTYVRTLVHDLGEILGCGAHVRELRRTASGSFRIDQAVSLEALQTLAQQQPLPLVALNTALAHLPGLSVSDLVAQRVLNGLVSRELIESVGGATGTFRLLAPSGDLLAVAAFMEDGNAISGRLMRVFPELCSLQG